MGAIKRFGGWLFQWNRILPNLRPIMTDVRRPFAPRVCGGGPFGPTLRYPDATMNNEGRTHNILTIALLRRWIPVFVRVHTIHYPLYLVSVLTRTQRPRSSFEASGCPMSLSCILQTSYRVLPKRGGGGLPRFGTQLAPRSTRWPNPLARNGGWGG